MGDILCLDDVPFQCQSCTSQFPTKDSLKMHCFVTGHRGAENPQNDVFCDCGENPDEPHQCDSCKLIGISVEGDRRGEGPNNKLYTQSQLWKCSGCGMLWKCIDCGILFKGSNKFRQHLPRCNDIEDVLRQLKQERESDDEADARESKFIKEEKHDPDVKFPIKQEFEIKREGDGIDIKPSVKQEVNVNIKQEGDLEDTKLGLKRDSDGTVKSEDSSVSYNGIRTRSRRERRVNED